MHIVPIILALWRRKIGAVLVTLQIALTLALVSNALVVVKAKLDAINLVSGIDEDNIVLIFNQWSESRTDNPARIAADLERLRSLPDSIDAYATNSVPLGFQGTARGIRLSRAQERITTEAALYMVDSHAARTLGIRLLGGRWFEPRDVEVASQGEDSVPSTVVLTQGLANGLFGNESALGKAIFLDREKPSTVIGVVDRTVSPFVGAEHIDFAVFAPLSMNSERYYYVLRASQGRRESVLNAATSALLSDDSKRVIGFATTFPEWRNHVHEGDRAVALVLGSVTMILLTVTALGIVGLSSYWVIRRRRQTGIRRALGARRIDIVGYFQLENLIIVMTGVLLGSVGAVAINLVLIQRFEMQRLGLSTVAVSAAVILALSQLSVLWPALRAAAIPPALAARSS